MIRRPPRSTQSRSSAASDVYKRQPTGSITGGEANLARQVVALVGVARCTGGNQVVPGGRPAPGSGYDVIQRKMPGAPTILATEAVSSQYSLGGDPPPSPPGNLDVVFESDDEGLGQADLLRSY